MFTERNGPRSQRCYWILHGIHYFELTLHEMFVILVLRCYRNWQWNIVLNWLFWYFCKLQMEHFQYSFVTVRTKNMILSETYYLLSSIEKIDKNDAKGNFLTEFIKIFYVSIICFHCDTRCVLTSNCSLFV